MNLISSIVELQNKNRNNPAKAMVDHVGISFKK